MTGRRPIRQAGSFVPCVGGARFRLVTEPAHRPARGTVVFVPAFAEEMNKSRRMVARAARQLGADGWRVVQRDPLGCGDSDGDFSDASWGDWISDVELELDQALPNLPTWLWCHRAGALLASAALATRPALNVLLWQPVLAGAVHLNQFLRLHAGARIAGGRDGTPSPAQLLREGQSVEVAGYGLSPELTRGLEQASFAIPHGHAGRVEIIDIHRPDDASDLAPRTAKLVEELTDRGVAVRARSVPGPSFWATQEIEDCDALLPATEAAISALALAPAPVAEPAGAVRG